MRVRYEKTTKYKKVEGGAEREGAKDKRDGPSALSLASLLGRLALWPAVYTLPVSRLSL